jgi:hypothetical protein
MIVSKNCTHSNSEMKNKGKNSWNIDLDNIFIIVPFFLFVIIDSIIKFTFLNLLALITFNNFIKSKASAYIITLIPSFVLSNLYV